MDEARCVMKRKFELQPPSAAIRLEYNHGVTEIKSKFIFFTAEVSSAYSAVNFHDFRVTVLQSFGTLC